MYLPAIGNQTMGVPADGDLKLCGEAHGELVRTVELPAMKCI